jgi:hypothetical protein
MKSLSPITEAEYWHTYETIRSDVEGAIESFYTWLAIKNLLAQDEAIWRKFQEHAAYWNIVLYSLQNTFFIILGRLFDNAADTHSLNRLLAITVEHPELFDKSTLHARKIKAWGGVDHPEWNYFDTFREPMKSELGALKTALYPHRLRFQSVYSQIRSKVFAHKVLVDQQQIDGLFEKTKLQELEDILFFLYDLMEVLGNLFLNGRLPVLGNNPATYRERIVAATGEVVRKLG